MLYILNNIFYGIRIGKPCTDNRADCQEYGKAACAPQYEKWAKQNCAKYCGYCGPGNISYSVQFSSYMFLCKQHH